MPIYPPINGEAGKATKWTSGIKADTTMIPRAISTPLAIGLTHAGLVASGAVGPVDSLIAWGQSPQGEPLA